MRGLVALLLALAPAMSVTPAASSAADTAAAPLTLPAMPLHDPWIVADRATRTYHLYTTNQPRMTGDPALGIMEYTSRDLAHWTRPRVVFAMPPGGWARQGAWAPEVHRWRGRWYLFSTFYDDAAPLPAHGALHPVRRATILAVADSPDGPFRCVRDAAPIADPARMTLDGTLYVDPAGKPWLVYAHEWVQIGDGTIEAMPLDATLAAAGPATVLFHASGAPWVAARRGRDGAVAAAVTDGPELFRTKTGALLMLWSSYDANGYVQAVARSRTGRIDGPWDQLAPLLRDDSGHGMLFRRWDGTLMLIVHHPFRNARGRLFDMRDAGDHLEIVHEVSNTSENGQTLRTSTVQAPSNWKEGS